MSRYGKEKSFRPKRPKTKLGLEEQRWLKCTKSCQTEISIFSRRPTSMSSFGLTSKQLLAYPRSHNLHDASLVVGEQKRIWIRDASVIVFNLAKKRDLECQVGLCDPQSFTHFSRGKRYRTNPHTDGIEHGICNRGRHNRCSGFANAPRFFRRSVD